MSAHAAASPLYREERNRWLMACACGWEQEAATRLEARLAHENHCAAMEERGERESESWTGPSGTVYPYDPREAYDLDDPKRLGPGGYW